MDPNEALKKLRDAMAALRTWNDSEEWSVSPADLAQHDEDIRDATESFEALDGWLGKGGFLPIDWRTTARA